MEKVRGISDGELMFCDVQELVNSYTIQFLVEFTGNISIKEIEDTINEIVIKNPGSNVFKNKNNYKLSIYCKSISSNNCFVSNGWRIYANYYFDLLHE